ncbi:MAG: FAD-binding protein [Acidimicrobiia bacterium]|nr:FAD-binding protein [Acidimicrobiia bacterium]
MTGLQGLETTTIPGAPEGVHVAPKTVEEVASVLSEATATGTPVRVWGGGTKQRLGRDPAPGIVLSTQHLDSVEHWEPDDLTLVVGAGAKVLDIETMLATRGQTAVLPERPGQATVGGAIATGTSSLRRGRLYGLRDRVLEVTVVTGDGRVVRSGGRVVKNVSGFDVHRAVVGAFGSLGVVVSACFKLWPIPEAALTIRIEGEIPPFVERPLAVLQTRAGTDLYLWGTEKEMSSIRDRVEGVAQPGLAWPDDPEGAFRWSLRVPPSSLGDALTRVAPWDFLAIHGVGEVRLGSDGVEGAAELREWAESLSGALVLTAHPGGEPPIDPWGAPPGSVGLQRRLIAEFDPARVINPGRLPGGI